MTAEIAVSVRDLTKSYRLFSTPLDRLKESLHPFRKRYHTEFWALKGISFDVLRGQIVGILGRNGSGKSTLLQIIASVLRPTSGTVTVSGPVSALLELGAKRLLKWCSNGNVTSANVGPHALYNGIR
jgi:lipopolysaccharide transport system ATP-binding protein